MANSRMLLSDKYRAFIKHNAPTEFLEGTTYAGKTTVGVFKFMLKVAESPQKLHILSGLDPGTIEKNIINKDLGIQDVFGDLVEYSPGGKGKNSLPHMILHTSSGDKIIYVLGYDNKTRWKKALGGQYGCLYIDEINIADMEYVREATMRCDYLIGTLNPDDPGLDIYSEYINHSRPLSEWESDTPKEIIDMLDQEPKPGWVHWFFSFADNAGAPQDKINQIMLNTPKGTKLWKNKIQGLRGKATGLVFSNFEHARHVTTKDFARQYVRDAYNGRQQEWFDEFSIGVDTAYSSKSPDTIAFSFIGITNKGKCLVLDERVYNNASLGVPIAPSDTVKNLIDFADRNRKEWGFARHIFLDYADQATTTEWQKYRRTNGCVYDLAKSWKKMEIIDRINLQLGWFATDDFFVLDHCKHYTHELDVYSWDEKKDNTPEDGNDHMINSVQYAWMPYKQKIGKAEKTKK